MLHPVAGMVRLMVALTVSPRLARGVTGALRTLMIPVQLQPECARCTLWTSADGVVHYLEEWETEASMRERVRSDAFTSILALMEVVEKPPDLRFEFISKTFGLEYVANVRRGPPMAS